MQRRGSVKDAVKKHEQEKKQGQVLSEELRKIEKKFKVKGDNEQNLIETADEAFKYYKKRYEESINIVDPKVEPIGQQVLLSCSLMSIDDVGEFLVMTDFSLDSFKAISEQMNPEQTVIAAGPACQQVKKGDKVVLDLQQFIRIKNPNSVKSEEVNDLTKHIEYINRKPYLIVHERQLRYIKRE